MLETAYTEPYHAWSTAPGPETAAGLLKAVDPVLRSALRAYGGPAADSPTLRGRAKRLALQAFETYDPARAGLKTHLMSHLRELHRHGQRETNVLRVPEAVLLDRHHLLQSEDELRERLGRDPSSAELADHAGLSLRRVARARGFRSALAEGQLSHREEGPSLPAVARAPEDEEPWRDFIYHGLAPTDQLILEHSTALHGKELLGTAALAKKLGVSPPAISQRKVRIQRLLNRRDDLGVL